MENQEDKVESTNKGGAPLGNKNAAKGSQLTALLHAALNANDRLKLRLGVEKVAEALILKAQAGDISAIKEFADRVDGKSVATQELTGPDGSALNISLPIEFKDAVRPVSE